MENLFRMNPKGLAAVLVVGGASEALNGSHDLIKLVLNKRKGFCKLALRHGVDLVPTFTFGEEFIYDQARLDCSTSQSNLIPLGDKSGTMHY